jgi:glutamine amidotransferase
LDPSFNMIVIVDYNAGNLTSVQLALRAEGIEAVISRDPAVIASAERLIFPGVGAAGSAMEGLRDLNLDGTVRAFVASGRPFLGICIGCQVILGVSEEDGGTICLGLLPGSVKAFKPFEPATGVESYKIPHMGWNQVHFTRAHPVIDGIPSGSDFYFVHSYFPSLETASDVLGATEYAGVRFPAIYARDNVVACQFHTEKSGPVGLRLLKNFCRWDGKS